MEITASKTCRVEIICSGYLIFIHFQDTTSYQTLAVRRTPKLPFNGWLKAYYLLSLAALDWLVTVALWWLAQDKEYREYSIDFFWYWQHLIQYVHPHLFYLMIWTCMKSCKFFITITYWIIFFYFWSIQTQIWIL